MSKLFHFDAKSFTHLITDASWFVLKSFTCRVNVPSGPDQDWPLLFSTSTDDWVNTEPCSHQAFVQDSWCNLYMFTDSQQMKGMFAWQFIGLILYPRCIGQHFRQRWCVMWLISTQSMAAWIERARLTRCRNCPETSTQCLCCSH